MQSYWTRCMKYCVVVVFGCLAGTFHWVTLAVSVEDSSFIKINFLKILAFFSTLN